MLDVYLAATPNGLKPRLFLEELADLGAPLPHRLLPVRLSAGEQQAPAFLAISPNGKIPAIVDHAPADGGAPLSLFESGAILQYLADKTGRLLPAAPRARWDVLQWLTWQVAGLGPMAGQAGWFRVHSPQRDDYAAERYVRETRRLYGVLDRRLAGRDVIAGDAYSIADIACWPWVLSHAGHGQALDEFPALARWFRAVGRRPATQRALVGYADPYARVRHPSAREVTA
ncbi:glutathione binding-like protein [Cognatiluteimonas weifangensis]|uniref:Thiol:disulfide oxidoreductase n=1 Tax=Cognatiluteimonas weifangensis TaxID=2303539 RepID=A0A372DNC5_9GAMM|nr:glutathione binding-like protein [Luteimonas weifangensis]RFP60832.1 thiol:disulfide oxidoreductase [Luteimonas weifangensis]